VQAENLIFDIDKMIMNDCKEIARKGNQSPFHNHQDRPLKMI
jgi:hypothetical protein